MTLSSMMFGQSYNFEFYNVEEGLAQSSVKSIIQDSRGHLWVGTQGGGACKFDGLNFVQFKERDGLSGNIITGISEDKEGNIWFTSTWGGVTKYTGRKFFLYKEEDGNVKTSNNHTVFTDSDGKVWIGHNGGITIYDHGNFKHIEGEKDGLSGNSVNRFMQDSKDRIWVATNNGITILDKDKKIIIRQEDGLMSNQVNVVMEDLEGNFYIGTNQGISILLAGSIDENRQFEFSEGGLTGLEANVQDIIITKEKEIWVATRNKGAFVLRTDGSISNITKKNGLATNDLLTLFQDHTGNLWIGTAGAGLIKFGNKAFTYFDEIAGLNNNSIFSITADADQKIWVCTSDEGVFRYETDYSVNFNEADGLGSNTVRSSLLDDEGYLWFATANGLSRYKDGRFKTYTTKDGLPSNRTRSLLLDKNGNLWVGTYGEGVAKFDGTTFTTYTSDDGMANGYIHVMYEHSSGDIWFGTGNGAVRYKDGKFTNYNNKKGFCNNYIGSITEDKFGNLWFGTDRCVVRYDGLDFTPITVHDGLSSGVIYLLHADKQGYLWVGTNNGIDRISFDSYGQISSIKNYKSKQGFKGIECNSRAVYEDKEGNIWVGTVKGLVKYNPKHDKTNTFEPVTHINNVKLYFEDVNWLSYSKELFPWNNLPVDLVLDHDNNHLTFEFSAINLILPEAVQYRFKLEPFDAAWFKPTNKTSATYSNLPPGDYTFKVIARNEDGVWNQEPATYNFTINSPWWREWWVMLLIMAALFYLFYKASSIRTKRQKLISKELEKKVKERTSLIETQRDEKEVLLKEIHHRVKNNMQVIISLLSIQSGYTNDEAALALFDEAKNRIRSMALIHEKMYQSGDLAHIDFQDYIVALTNDLITTYSINTDIFLDIKIERVKFGLDTLIPLGLLLNEIVSNSLKYAFKGLDRGKVLIHLTENEDGETYKLIVGDDGIGMPNDLLEKDGSTLGIELIKIFVSQLDGELKRTDDKGTVFNITFKERG